MQPALHLMEATKLFHESQSGRVSLLRRGWLRSVAGLQRTRVQAVDHVSFSVSKGEIFGVLGPNGSGKSTLIRLIATLLLPDEGRIEVFGHDVVREQLAVRRLINRVSVDAAFFKKLSARENLIYAGQLYGLRRAEIRDRMADILDVLGFPRKKLDASLSDLSRGQQQKVAVARAMLTSPMLVLLDEPTTGLDPKSRRDVQDFVLTMRAQHDATVILTSHDMEEVSRLADRTAVLHRGRIAAIDSPRVLIDRFGAEGQLLRGSSGPASLEDVFFALTGSDADEEDDE